MKREPGFTLIEVMVSVVVLAMISLLIWQSSRTTIFSKERFEEREGKTQSASLTLQQMTRDLEAAYLYSSPALLGRLGNGEQSTKTAFIGKDQGDQDSIHFNSWAHVRYREDSKESDQAEVSYFLEKDPEGAESFVLKKRVSSPPDMNPEEGGGSITLLQGVRELNFRYYDGRRNEYAENWNSTGVDDANQLPRLVEIALVLEGDYEEDDGIRFQTTVFLGMAPGPNDF